MRPDLTNPVEVAKWIKTVAEQSSPGPWVVWSSEKPDHSGRATYSICHHVGDLHVDEHQCVAQATGAATGQQNHNNAVFITAAREAPLLADAVIEMAAEIEALRMRVCVAENELNDERARSATLLEAAKAAYCVAGGISRVEPGG